MSLHVIGYLRVSTDEQGRSGLGLEAQRETIAAEADRRGWTVEWISDEGVTAKDLDRPGLQRALRRLEGDEPDPARPSPADASMTRDAAMTRDEVSVQPSEAKTSTTRDEPRRPFVLVVAKLDRLSRSLLDFLTLTERAKEKGWAIVVLDMGTGEALDMSSPVGKFTASVVASVAELERGLISVRTKEALARAKARGTQIGRRPTDPKLVRKIQQMREQGMTLQQIATRLNGNGVPTPQGGYRWWPSTIRSVLETARRREHDQEHAQEHHP